MQWYRVSGDYKPTGMLRETKMMMDKIRVGLLYL